MKIVNTEGGHIPTTCDIYVHYVLHGTGSFETNPPDTHEMLACLEKIRNPGLLWVVALQEDKVIGYCCLTRCHEYYAYRYILENLIYIAPTAQYQGIGEALPRHVTSWAETQGYRQLIAIVGDSSNQGPLKVRQQTGFTRIGTLRNIGPEHGLWLDTVLLQRSLGEGSGALPSDSGVAI